ncbi:UDP-N-acetylmuramoyl-L-alanine--D-glutamate ligase [Candidatus Saccharibacteria bacterium]|nr:UDP-N-acetylmuramoyl-L-alanine--D-glutamate ligase [Candidatus Saccharibacteria bacterium]
MKIAIVGFATDGRVSAEYFTRHGHIVTVCDESTEIDVPEVYEKQLGASYLHDMARFDVIVRSSGIHPSVIVRNNPGVEGKITTSVNECLAHCPTPNTIGVTGTKGKGTTSTLITKMLEAAGKRVFLGGNIGRSPLEFLDEVTVDDWVVLELSSFQLSDLRHSPHIAVCLMVVPEHLNWHSDMADYKAAKSHLFAQQKSDDVAIYFAENSDSTEIASHGSGRKVPYFTEPGAHIENGAIVIEDQRICSTDELKLLGKHNWQNACAAVTAVWQADVHDTDAICSVLTSFAGLEHRLEFVREFEGVRYYDDSFGTTPETAIVAIQSFEQPKIIILGGSDKGADYGELAQVVSESTVRQIIIVGNTANRAYVSGGPAIESALRNLGLQNITSLIKAGPTTMEEIVSEAYKCAQPGDVVLLSTACASFDIFENYKDRGWRFKQAVQALA